MSRPDPNSFPKGQKTEYQYDDVGRLETIRYFNASASLVKTVAFAHDRVGNLLGYDDGATSAQYSYDSTYHKLSETVDLGALELSYSYTYYDNGMKQTFIDPDGVTYTYTYDAANQLTAVQIPGQGTITYGSYTWDHPASITLPGGSKKEFIYDPLMRVKEITANDPAQNVLLNCQYSYDKMDNILSKQTEYGSYSYVYDELYRLINADNPTLADETYTYDPAGNRLTSANISGNWSYNQNNELQNYNSVSFSYDQNGSTIWKNDNGTITHYIYNAEDRLAEVRDGSGSLIASYYYDPFGRRLWKEVGGKRTYFIYCDEGLAAEYDLNGSLTKTYGYEPNSSWTSNPIFLKENDQYYFYHNDHLGTPQKMTTSSGAIVWSATYSSFGEVLVDASSTITNNLRFPGQYEDEETGLFYNWYRYYEPRLGRYLRVDPVSLEGGLNFYIYGENNPIYWIDFYGLDTLCFNGTELIWMCDEGNIVETYKATSGGFGKKIPDSGSKPYSVVKKGSYAHKKGTVNKGFCIGNTCFTAKIEGVKGRKGLYIHPDGNKKGTKGCVGISNEDDAKKFWKRLQDYWKDHDSIDFEVGKCKSKKEEICDKQ